VANRTKPSVQGGAPEKIREDRRRGRGCCSPAVTKPTDNACRYAEFRREISRRLVGDSEEKQREKREALVGFL
jgi:hypothetical protein